MKRRFMAIVPALCAAVMLLSAVGTCAREETANFVADAAYPLVQVACRYEGSIPRFTQYAPTPKDDAAQTEPVTQSAGGDGDAIQTEGGDANGENGGGVEPNCIFYILIGVAALVLAAMVVIIFTRKRKPAAAVAQAVPASAPQAADGAAEIQPAQPAPQHLPDEPPQPMLVGVAGVFEGCSCPLAESVRIGRDPHRCSIVFPPETPGVSALHCEAALVGGNVMVTDLGSTYGTFLENGSKLQPNQPCALKPGDAFYLGSKQNGFSIQ